MLLQTISLLVGLFVLVRAGDVFVEAAAQLARSLKMSSVVIGAIVLGFGTSAPELVVSTIAAWRGNAALGVGNIVGSNVANLSLVLGVAALITPIALTSSVIKRQAPLSIAAVVAFAVTVVDGNLSRSEGTILFVLLVGAMIVLVKTPEENSSSRRKAEKSVVSSLLWSLLGLGGVLIGAQLVVWGATQLAERWGLSGGFIGFSLVALGTSLPELVTAIAAARKHEAGLIVGNLFGSNLFNSLAGGAAMGLAGAGRIGDTKLTTGALCAMLGAVIWAYARGALTRQIGKTDALMLLAIYVGAMVYLAVG